MALIDVFSRALQLIIRASPSSVCELQIKLVMLKQCNTRVSSHQPRPVCDTEQW
jgi:hypothetical protein